MNITSNSINTPLTRQQARQLKAGDKVLLSGTIYTARDAAHKRIHNMLTEGKQPPFPLEGQIIYYVGPTPAPPGKIIGSAGPTTAYRMDDFTPLLLKMGITATIGKGKRGENVIDAMKEYGSVYLAALGGGGAILHKCIKSVQVIAFEDLGTEAVRKLEIENFPAVVAIDSYGNNLFERKK